MAKLIKRKNLKILREQGFEARYIRGLGEEPYVPPAIRLMGPKSGDHILLAWIEPDDEDRAFGITYIDGISTMGEISIKNLEYRNSRGEVDFKIDENWTADPLQPLRSYLPQPKSKRAYRKRSEKNE